MQEGKDITYLIYPWMVESIQLQSPPEVVEFLRCNNADNEWYRRMPTDPTLVDPKVKSCLGNVMKKIPFQK